MAGVAVRSPYALLTVVLDGAAAAIVIVPPMLAGLWLVPLVTKDKLPWRWHVLLGFAFGLGVTSTLVLALGVVGRLDRSLWVFVLGAMAVAGVVRVAILVRRAQAQRAAARESEAHGHESWRWLWLLVPPFLSLALLAAATAPGLIWQEEGYGYDTLEYHLQLPKEYHDLGHIGYVPHNVYANFPANVEMLYLLAMIILDDTVDVGTVTKMIHLALAGLTVFALWVAGREWSPRAGIVVAVTGASTGWLAYLSGLAYVENGMLFFAAAAAAVMIRLLQRTSPGQEGPATGDPPGARLTAAAGVLSGFACGCKYTALPMLAIPIGLAVLLVPGRRLVQRGALLALFGSTAFLAFAPWLAKNVAYTGNPLFPLAGTIFDAAPEGWGVEEAAQWDRGHTVSDSQRSVAARLSAGATHIVLDRYQRFGPALFILALGGLLGRRRDRVDLFLVGALLLQLGVWLFATHLFARFAVVLLIPLVLLAARALGNGLAHRRAVFVAVLVIAGCIWNFVAGAKLHAEQSPRGGPSALIYKGSLPGFEYFAAVNDTLPPDAYILLVGDAKAFYFQRRIDYCVTFNRNPFFERVLDARAPADVTRWLRQKGYTHVLVHWGELRRLSATYGLAPPVPVSQVEEMFHHLTDAGLTLVTAFPHPTTGGRYVELYETTP